MGGLLVDPWTHFRLSPWSHMPSGPPQPDWSASLVQYGTLSTRSRAESEGTTRGPGPHLPSPRPPPPTPVFLLPHLVWDEVGLGLRREAAMGHRVGAAWAPGPRQGGPCSTACTPLCRGPGRFADTLAAVWGFRAWRWAWSTPVPPMFTKELRGRRLRGSLWKPRAEGGAAPPGARSVLGKTPQRGLGGSLSVSGGVMGNNLGRHRLL